MLSIQGNINIKLEAFLVKVFEFRHNANDLPVIISARGAGPVLFFQFDIVEGQI